MLLLYFLVISYLVVYIRENIIPLITRFMVTISIHVTAIQPIRQYSPHNLNRLYG